MSIFHLIIILGKLGSCLWYLNTSHFPVSREDLRDGSSIDRKGVEFSWCCQAPGTVEQGKGLTQATQWVRSGAGTRIKGFSLPARRGHFRVHYPAPPWCSLHGCTHKCEHKNLFWIVFLLQGAHYSFNIIYWPLTCSLPCAKDYNMLPLPTSSKRDTN